MSGSNTGSTYVITLSGEKLQTDVTETKDEDTPILDATSPDQTAQTRDTAGGD